MANGQNKHNKKYVCRGSWDDDDKDDNKEMQSPRHGKAIDHLNRLSCLRLQPKM